MKQGHLGSFSGISSFISGFLEPQMTTNLCLKDHGNLGELCNVYKVSWLLKMMLWTEISTIRKEIDNSEWKLRNDLIPEEEMPTIRAKINDLKKLIEAKLDTLPGLM